LSLQHVDDGAETDAIKYDLLLADLLHFFYESSPSLPGKIDAGLRDFGDHVICHSDILTVQTKASRTEHFHDKYQQLSLNEAEEALSRGTQIKWLIIRIWPELVCTRIDLFSKTRHSSQLLGLDPNKQTRKTPKADSNADAFLASLSDHCLKRGICRYQVTALRKHEFLKA
jgi:hypothetical protein